MSSGSTGRRSLRLGPCHLHYPGDTATRLFGVLGHPVAHSLSPVMQQAAFDAAGCNARYVPLDVRPDQLDSFLQDARRTDVPLAGFNVTAPHKQALQRAVDVIEDTAACAGAVNTVVIDRRHRWHGFNTDISGLQHLWRQQGRPVDGGVLVVIGAGGLARAAVVAALHEGVAEIRVLHRSVERASAMLDDVTSRWSGVLPALRCATPAPQAAAWLRDATVLVQATPVGRCADDPSPVSLAEASSVLLVIESLYGVDTALLRQARELSLPCLDGRELLLAQGEESWRLWMHRDPDRQAMWRALQA